MDAPETAFSTFRWQPGAAGDEDDPTPLSERLAPLVDDRAAAGDEVARAVVRKVHGWLCAAATADTVPDAEVGAALGRELADVLAVHGWRGPVAGLRRALDGARERAREVGATAREAMAEECALWLEPRESASGDGWNGEPLEDGVRLPDRARCAAPFVDPASAHALERGEIVVVHGWSETVARALEEAEVRGLAPEAIVSEGGPDLGGRRLARRLVASGLAVRFVYDAALFDAVRRADRVWLGTEAIGAEAFAARVGTRALLEEASRAEVPTAVLATSDKLVPGGSLALPAWCEKDAWLLWESAPDGVRVESQAYEAVPLDLPDVFATEFGLVRAAELSLRALRTDRVPA